MLKYPIEAYTYWAERCGWHVQEEDKAPSQPNILDDWEVGLPKKEFDEIKDITPETYAARLKKRRLTQTDKEEQAKFKFSNILFDIPEKLLPDALWELYSSRPRKVYNMLSLRDNKVDDVMTDEWGRGYRAGCNVQTWLEMRPLQQHAIEGLQKELGKLMDFKNGITLEEKDLESALGWVERNIRKLEIPFQTRWDDPYRALKGINQWGHFDITVLRENRQKKKKHTFQKGGWLNLSNI